MDKEKSRLKPGEEKEQGLHLGPLVPLVPSGFPSLIYSSVTAYN